MLKTFVVKPDESIQRIEKYLMKVLKNLSRAQIFKLLRLKEVKVNNARVNCGSKIYANDVIQVWLPDQMYQSVKAQNNNNKLEFLKCEGQLDIAFEDKNILLIDKPIGIGCQPSARDKYETIQNRLLKYLYQTKQWSPDSTFCPSICNRLDTNTSGLVLAAKNNQALQELNHLIKDRVIAKFYRCLVFGILDKKQDTLSDFLIKNSATNLVKVCPNKLDQNYLTIITKYKVIKEYKRANWSLLDVELITGRTHQIRAHLSYIKHPIVGDHKYGLDIYHDANKKYEHQCLHAFKVAFPQLDASKYPKLNYLSNTTFESKHKPWFFNINEN